ncbi:MAG TPA: hypothetical protein VNA57_00370 [Acidimicrobiales bacterium]|nr:hypothetical protein [Acidimicrobiales bacterium]
MTAGPIPGHAGGQTPYFDALRHQLVGAAGRRTTRRPPRSAAFLLAAAAVLVAVGSVALFTVAPPATAGVEVRRAGDRVELRLVGDDVDAEEVERAAAKAGVRVRVTHYAVGPSLADRFVAVVADPILPPDFARFDEATGSFRGFALPVSWKGNLRLGLGRRARGDERYTFASDAFAPGEPLACHDVRGLPAPEAAQVLGRVSGLSVVWEVQAPTGARPTTPVRSPTARVIGAEAVSRSRVIVMLDQGKVVATGRASRCGSR